MIDYTTILCQDFENVYVTSLPAETIPEDIHYYDAEQVFNRWHEAIVQGRREQNNNKCE